MELLVSQDLCVAPQLKKLSFSSSFREVVYPDCLTFFLATCIVSRVIDVAGGNAEELQVFKIFRLWGLGTPRKSQ
nr:hypothetical protein HmN_000946500 [Hymenolepis microstoma]